MASKRFYWIRLLTDFFEEPRIMILEGEQNGKEIIVFYLKILLKSVRGDDGIGELRLNEQIAYTDEMLSSLTRTEISFVGNAISTLQKYGLIEKRENGTYYLPEAEKLVGSETSDAERKRKSRQS